LQLNALQIDRGNELAFVGAFFFPIAAKLLKNSLNWLALLVSLN